VIYGRLLSASRNERVFVRMLISSRFRSQHSPGDARDTHVISFTQGARMTYVYRKIRTCHQREFEAGGLAPEEEVGR
jgi:hypothetical protein